MSDDANDEGWNPEDDKIGDKYMKKAMELMDRLGRQSQELHVPALRACEFSIQIRAIDNGFLLSYTKAVQSGAGWRPGGAVELFFDSATLGNAMEAIAIAIEDLRRLKNNLGGMILGA